MKNRKRAAMIAIVALVALCAAAVILVNASEILNRHAPDKDGDAVDPSTAVKSIGADDDGGMLEVARGEPFLASFIEHDSTVTWRLRPTADVEVISDVLLESYPMQHQMRLRAVRSGTLYFDQVDATDNAVLRTVSVTLQVKG